MIDHTGIQVSDPAKSRQFYDQALAPLGYILMKKIPKQFMNGIVALDPDGHNIEAVCHTPE